MFARFHISVTFRRVQEIDGSYFESFTALAWKQENQRQSVLKASESSAADTPPQEVDLGIVPIDFTASQNEKEKLYVEMLYTIANTVSGVRRVKLRIYVNLLLELL